MRRDTERAMAYLIDHIREIAPDVAKNIPKGVICVDATPVWKWCEMNKRKEYDIRTDFPFLRSPYPHLWIEHRNTDENEIPCRIGVYVSEVPSEAEPGAFHIKLEVYAKFDDDTALSILPTAYAIRVNADGSPRLGIDGLPRFGYYMNPSMPDKFEMPSEEQIMTTCMSQAVVALLSLSFMNCKNITVETERDISDALNKKRARIGRPPLVRMHTLVIDGMKKLFHELTGSHHFTKAAYHLCRGHFKDFSHGAGLFGRYKGRYWWGSQARGSKEAGEVIKDYTVKI